MLRFGTFGIWSENKVDYTIPDIEKLFEDTSIENYWVFKIAACKNINDLPEQLKELVIQYLPRFFAQYPKYKDAECLKVSQGKKE